MKIASLYDEAVEAGLDRREASYIAAAHDIALFARTLKEEQTNFLSEIGMSWEEARELDDQGKASLNEQWSAYRTRRGVDQ
jgi:hypothetical protein